MNLLKKIRLIFAILFLNIASYSQNPVNVLFVGNSFTAANGLSQLFQGIAANAGVTVYVAERSPGGASVGDTVHSSIVHMYDTALYNLIRSRAWDYLVLQDNQGAYINSYGVFSSVSNVIAGNLRIRDSLLANNPCANIVLFSGWALQGGYPPYGLSEIQMIQRIFANYSFLNDTLHQIIAPIGPAWITSLNNYPSINLWGPDSTHPSLEGSYLTACVIFAAIFKKDPANSIYTGGLNLNDAQNLNNIAFPTVIDSLSQCNLDSFTPSLSIIVDTLFTDTGFVTYKWYKGGGLYQTTSVNYLKINFPATYYVECIDANSCIRRSFELHVTSTHLNNISYTVENSFYPNPAKENINIVFNSSYKDLKLYVLNSFGVRIIEKKIKNIPEGYCQTIDLKSLCNGIYFIQITSDKETSLMKIIVCK
jgi:hypothetical protein